MAAFRLEVNLVTANGIDLTKKILGFLIFIARSTVYYRKRRSDNTTTSDFHFLFTTYFLFDSHVLSDKL